FNDVFGVRVVLGEDQCLRNFAATGEYLRQIVTERADDGSDLILRHHAAVELVRLILEIVIKLLPANFARLTVAKIKMEASLDFPAALGDVGSDAEHVIADIDAVHNGALVAVLGDKVLIEEAERLLARRRGQTDQERIEVFERLSPKVVNRTVAFICDDKI